MYQPNIIETIGKSTKVIDIPTKLFQNRIIYLGEDIDEESANACIHQLLVLDYLNNEDINFYIKSPGGVITDVFAIKDVIYSLKSKVNTIGIGQCCSGGSYLLACGTGIRKCTRSCRIMIHPVLSANSYKSMPDLKISFEESQKVNELFFEGYKQFSKNAINDDNIALFERDHFMGAEEALKYNIIDEII